MEQEGSSSERDKKLKNSFESPKAGAESEKKPEKKKPRLVLVELPTEAEGAKKTEQAAGQPKPPEQLFAPKPASQEEEKAEEPTWQRPKLVVLPGVKETAPEATKDEETPEAPEAEEASSVTESAPEKPEAAEAESSAPEITDEEKPAVINEYVDAAQPALKEELADLPEDSPEVPEVMANVVFLDKLREAANKGEPLDESGVEEVFEQTAQVLKLPVGEAVGVEDELDEELSEEDLESSEEPGAETPEEAAQVLPADTEAAQNAAQNSLNPPTTNVHPLNAAAHTPTATPMGGLPTTPLAHGGGGGGTLGGPGGPPLGPNALGMAPNVLPNVLKPLSAERRKQRRKHMRNIALTAGIAYLVGRGHGRRSAERKAAPGQRKMEREVKDLHDKVAIQERRIRKLVAAKVAQSPESTRAIADVATPFVARLDSRPPVRQPEQAPSRPEAAVVSGQERAEEAADAPAYREREIMYTQRQPEKLGKFVVVSTPENAATVPAAAAENVARAYESSPVPLEVKPDNIDATTIPQLLEVATKITINGVNVEQLFRAERLDTAGLRKVVTEYVRGGNPERVLDQQLKLVEAKRSQSMEYLRPSAIQLSDSAAPAGGGGGGGQPATQLNPLTPLSPAASTSHITPQQTPPIQAKQEQRKTSHVAQVTAIATLGGVGTILVLLLLL